ncbi:hypothetical protein PCORN_06105 [Listeria cornellensis FSL F6-0969]|uniref:Uncharacterized protein n=1 Tax=Listeria cornellensis FSL F6-0969 TaxID=1265820 RepID=W7C5V6_9LIST|nr:hypothetical protein PCORN_06105 [Listeria cornellensis FSL F6-0969]
MLVRLLLAHLLEKLASYGLFGLDVFELRFFLAWFSGVLFEYTVLVWIFTYRPSNAFSGDFFHVLCAHK